MPAPAPIPAPDNIAADTTRPDDTWDDTFATGDVDAQPGPSRATSLSGAPLPHPLDTLTPSDIPGPHMRRDGDNANLPALLSLQHAELDRLVRDNGKLMDRIKTLLQIQSREQVLRQQLQNQADRISEQMNVPVPSATLEAVRREARAGVTEEIKPVLMAILDALERFANKAGSEATAPQIVEPTDPYHGEDYGKLPAILTRPLTELMDDGSVPGRSNNEAANRRPRKSPFHKRKRTRPAPASTPENTDGPAPFTWSTVFTS